MRRQPNDIKVKDFVDDKTKRNLVKLVGKDKDNDNPKVYTSEREFLAYLSQARTTQEIKTRFGYKTLAAAWKAVNRSIKNNNITVLGHGLYVAASAGVSQFNLNDLPEEELQARGYDAFKKHIEEEKIEEAKLAPVPPSSGSAGKTRVRGGRSNAGWGKRYDEILEYLGDSGRTAREVADEFNYKSIAGARWALVSLEAKGLVMPLKTGTVPARWARYSHKPEPTPVTVPEFTPAPIPEPTEEIKVEEVEAPPEKIEEPVPQTMVDELSTQIEEQAMKYAWETDIDQVDKTAVRAFIRWVKENQ